MAKENVKNDTKENKKNTSEKDDNKDNPIKNNTKADLGEKITALESKQNDIIKHLNHLIARVGTNEKNLDTSISNLNLAISDLNEKNKLNSTIMSIESQQGVQMGKKWSLKSFLNIILTKLDKTKQTEHKHVLDFGNILVEIRQTMRQQNRIIKTFERDFNLLEGKVNRINAGLIIPGRSLQNTTKIVDLDDIYTFDIEDAIKRSALKYTVISVFGVLCCIAVMAKFKITLFSYLASGFSMIALAGYKIYKKFNLKEIIGDKHDR